MLIWLVVRTCLCVLSRAPHQAMELVQESLLEECTLMLRRQVSSMEVKLFWVQRRPVSLLLVSSCEKWFFLSYFLGDKTGETFGSFFGWYVDRSKKWWIHILNLLRERKTFGETKLNEMNYRNIWCFFVYCPRAGLSFFLLQHVWYLHGDTQCMGWGPLAGEKSLDSLRKPRGRLDLCSSWCPNFRWPCCKYPSCSSTFHQKTHLILK